MTGISTEAVREFGGNPYSPIGTVLGPGSTSLRMSAREYQVATLVALGYNYKRVAAALGDLTTATVAVYVAGIGARIPGAGNPRQKVSAWMWTYGGRCDGDGEG